MWFYNNFWQFKKIVNLILQVHNMTDQSLPPFRAMLLKSTTNSHFIYIS